MTEKANQEEVARRISFLLVGEDALLSAALFKIYANADLHRVPYELDKLLNEISPPPEIILCAAPPAEIALSEIGQLLSSQYKGASLFLVVDRNQKIDRKLLLKNGFMDIFVFPADRLIFVNRLETLVAHMSHQKKVFKPIKLIDLSPETVLDFDTYLYLPANNRHIRFTASGDEISKDRVERLQKHEVGSLLIDSQDTKKFYSYTAQQLKKIQKSHAISETEKSARLTGSIRELFGSLFTDVAGATDSGKAIVAEAQEIVKSYILIDGNENWYNRIVSISSQSLDIYSHAANTSTYASLFAIGLESEHVEEIAIAGLLHDLGLERISESILLKPLKDLDEKQMKEYEKHPEYSIDIIKEKKLILPDLVRKIILQHEERFNGMGFPKKLHGNRICQEAQILAIADRFDELTTIQPGRNRLTPLEAIRFLHRSSVSDPSKMEFDPEILKKILKLFPKVDG